jgi:hypothetical protein
MPPDIVIPERLERSTHSLEGCCSIQLSYGTIQQFKNSRKYNHIFSFLIRIASVVIMHF